MIITSSQTTPRSASLTSTGMHREIQYYVNKPNVELFVSEAQRTMHFIEDNPFDIFDSVRASVQHTP